MLCAVGNIFGGIVDQVKILLAQLFIGFLAPLIAFSKFITEILSTLSMESSDTAFHRRRLGAIFSLSQLPRQDTNTLIIT